MMSARHDSEIECSAPWYPEEMTPTYLVEDLLTSAIRDSESRARLRVAPPRH